MASIKNKIARAEERKTKKKETPKTVVIRTHGPKPDEQALFLAFFALGGHVRDLGPLLGIHPSRVKYLCEKWERKGLYEYGVSVDLGWLTEEGKKKGRAISLVEAADRVSAEAAKCVAGAAVVGV